MRNEVVTSAMFEAATRAIVDALDLSACWVLRVDSMNKAHVTMAEPDGAVVPDTVLRALQMERTATAPRCATSREL